MTLNYHTLNVAYDELIKIEEFELAEKIQFILENNELSKPILHNKKEDKNTSFYEFNLNEEDIIKIQDRFLQLEVNSLSANGESTELTSFYSNLVDEWRNYDK